MFDMYTIKNIQLIVDSLKWMLYTNEHLLSGKGGSDSTGAFTYLLFQQILLNEKIG